MIDFNQTNQIKATHSAKIALWVLENNRNTTLQLDEKNKYLTIDDKKYLIIKGNLSEKF